MKNIHIDSSYKIELHIFPSIYQESGENLHHLHANFLQKPMMLQKYNKT